MKKGLKIAIIILISILSYVGFYYILTSSLTVKNSWSLLLAFYTSIFASLFGILLGFLLVWHLQKKKLESIKIEQLKILGGLIWMGLFGWLSICGFILGETIAEKPAKSKIKQINKNLLLDLNGLGTKYWILSVFIALSAVIIPIITMVLFPSNLYSTYPLILLAISATILSGYFFKENKNRKKGLSYTQFQKSILILIIGLFLIEIISAGFMFINRDPHSVSVSANSIGEEYANSMTYYSDKIDNSLEKIQDKIDKKDYSGARLATKEYLSLRQNMSNKFFELCDKAENQSITLNGTSALDEMNLTCSHRDLLTPCNNEESVVMLANIDFLQKTTKTKADCYEVIKIMEENTGKCIKLQSALGDPVDNENWSEMKEKCNLLPEKAQGAFGF